MALEVQQIPNALFGALGITHRQGFRPMLSPWVVPVVQIPYEETPDVDEGHAYARSCLRAAGGAGQRSHTQVFNPVGSGRIVYVDRCTFIHQAAALIGLSARLYNTALGTLEGSLYATDSGESGSAAELRTALNAGTLGTEIWTTLSTQNVILTYQPVRPIRLGEGEGFIINCNGDNANLYASYEIREFAAA